MARVSDSVPSHIIYVAGIHKSSSPAAWGLEISATSKLGEKKARRGALDMAENHGPGYHNQLSGSRC